MLTNPKDIAKWLSEHSNLSKKDCEITSAGFVDAKVPVEIHSLKGNLEVRFGSVPEFHMHLDPDASYGNHGASVTSFVGLPRRVESSCFVSGSAAKSFAGLPEYVGKNLFLNFSTGLVDMTTLEVKTIKNKLFLTDTNVMKGLIKVLQIKDLTAIQFNSGDQSVKSAVNIINKYLAMPRSPSNMSACQDELIDAGLDDQADF